MASDPHCPNGHRPPPEYAGAGFCALCGAPMIVTCPHGHEVRSAPFCSTCGDSLTSVPPQEPVPDSASAPLREPVSDLPPPTARRPRSDWMPFFVLMGLNLLLAVGGFLGAGLMQRPTQSAEPVPGQPWSSSEPNAPPSGTSTGMVTVLPAAMTADSSAANGVARTFDTYFTGINDRDPGRSLAVMTSRAKGGPEGQATFAKDVSTSHDTDVVIHSLTTPSPGEARAAVTFTSTQAPEYGEGGNTCLRWSLIYTLEETGGTYLIDRSEPAGGTGYSPC